MNCSPFLALWGPISVCMGAYALYIGIMCWLKPESKLVRGVVLRRYDATDEAGRRNLQVWRLIGPLAGGAICIAGSWVTVTQLGCGLQLPVVPRNPVYDTCCSDWNPEFVCMGLRWCVPVALLSAGFGFAASQAAAFHTGTQAIRWFVAALVCGAASSLMQWRANAITRRGANSRR